MKRRLLQAFITCVVMSSLVITPVLATPQVDKSKLNELNKNVENLEGQKAEAEAEAQTVNNNLSDLLLEYSALEVDIENQEKKINKAEKNLTAAEAKEKQQYEDMKLRIKYMYEQGDASVIETLVQAKDFTDLVNKAEYVQEVHTYDREQLARYVETKNEVKKIKEGLEEGYAEMQFLADEMKVQKANLEVTLAEMKAEIENFDEQLAKAKEDAAEELQRIQEETERLEREERERREREEREQAAREEAARQEAARQEAEREEQNNQNSSSDSSSSETEDDYTPPPSNASLGQQIADMGCRYIGNKYVYGGNSLTNGIDCSGFVQQIHAKFGISTPRTSSSLRYSGKAVSYSDMLPGDVVCYSGHVAIYIGNNQIVHASNSAPYPKGGIKISSPPNYRTVLAVRRYW